MSRTHKFVYNSISTGVFQLAVMIAGFITPRIMLVYYGSEINGLVSSITQFIVYFNLVEAGLSSAAVYSLYKPLAESDYNHVNAILTATKKFYIKTGYIFLSLTIGLAVFYPTFVSSSTISPFNVAVLVLVLGANGVLEFFTLAKYRVLLTADQKTYVISLASLIQIVVNTIIIVILGTMQVNIVIIRFVALGSIFIKSLILMIYTKTTYKYLNYKEKPDYESLKNRWDALYLQVLGAIQNGAPVVILTLMTGDLKLVSIYTIFHMVAGALNGILSIFTSGLAASFGEVIAKKELATLQKAYIEFELAYYSLITIVYSISFVSIMPFIRLYTEGISDANYNLPIVGFLFILNGFLYNIKTPQGMLIISAGLFKETRYQTTLQGIIAVLIGIILAPRFGVSGVLIGAILSNLYRDIDLLFFVPRYVTKLSVSISATRILRMIIVVIIICLPPMLLTNINITGYISWGLYAITIGVYAICIVIINNLIFEKVGTEAVFFRILSMVKK